ncbi:unnamed protein product [Staurois parvus]|uniref:Uncharacterized protein n=1 Tax=Staurois parvus TaxID=386267 RepID=A0ABN9F5R6_9NEOB|nr:unnamed protein product [Staurois parvus]
MLPAISEDFQQGRDLYVNNTDLSPVSSCTLLCMVLHSRAIQSTHNPIVKQHTANRLISPDVNPFLLSVINTVSVLFISTDHCIGVTGDVSDTKSVPPSVRMPAVVLL